MTVWKDAMSVAESIFFITESLPKKEDYGLTSQIRRSALSVSANIAEAFGRHHVNDKVNFYYYSRGSVTETKSHLEYGVRVKYFEKTRVKEIETILNKVYFELNKIIKSIKNR
jgi:four helix bundle protein